MNTWAKGIIAAFITSSSGVLASVIVDPDHFNLDHSKHLLMVAAITGIVGVASYLKQSPLPKE